MHNRSGFCVHHPTATPIGNGDRHRLLHARLGDHVIPHTDRYTRTLCRVLAGSPFNLETTKHIGCNELQSYFTSG